MLQKSELVEYSLILVCKYSLKILSFTEFCKQQYYSFVPTIIKESSKVLQSLIHWNGSFYSTRKLKQWQENVYLVVPCQFNFHHLMISDFILIIKSYQLIKNMSVA